MRGRRIGCGRWRGLGRRDGIEVVWDWTDFVEPFWWGIGLGFVVSMLLWVVVGAIGRLFHLLGRVA